MGVALGCDVAQSAASLRWCHANSPRPMCPKRNVCSQTTLDYVSLGQRVPCTYHPLLGGRGRVILGNVRSGLVTWPCILDEVHVS